MAFSPHSIKMLLFTLFSAVFFISCSQVKNSAESEDIVLHIGSACGWCAGTDSLYISYPKLHYEYKPGCGEKGLIKDSIISKEDWNALVATLDMAAFNKITLNTCAVCADGCDTWISVKKGNAYHKITFDYTDHEQLNPVRTFVDRLIALKKKTGVR